MLHSAKMPPMGSTRRTSHWWHFLLGDAIDPLSQQIHIKFRMEGRPDPPLASVALRELARAAPDTVAVREPATVGAVVADTA